MEEKFVKLAQFASKDDMKGSQNNFRQTPVKELKLWKNCEESSVFGTNNLEIPFVGRENVLYSQSFGDGHQTRIDKIQSAVSIHVEQFDTSVDICGKQVDKLQGTALEAIQACTHHSMSRTHFQKMRELYDDDVGKQ